MDFAQAFRNTSIACVIAVSLAALGAVLSVLALAGCDTVATLQFMFATDGTEALCD